MELPSIYFQKSLVHWKKSKLTHLPFPLSQWLREEEYFFSPRAKVQECAQKYSLQWLPACDWPSWRGWHCKWMALTSTCGFIILDATQKTYIYIHTYIHNIYIHIYIYLYTILSQSGSDPLFQITARIWTTSARMLREQLQNVAWSSLALRLNGWRQKKNGRNGCHGLPACFQML